MTKKINMAKSMVLVCESVRYYSSIDEELCFKWIKKIKSINTIEGIGKELHLIMKSNEISTKDLLELIGLFRRYSFDIQQLKIFMNDKNKIIFKSLDKL